MVTYRLHNVPPVRRHTHICLWSHYHHHFSVICQWFHSELLPQLKQRSGKTWVSLLYFCTDPCVCLFGCKSASLQWLKPATCRQNKETKRAPFNGSWHKTQVVIIQISAYLCSKDAIYISVPSLAWKIFNCAKPIL